jgi:hypothetical protein
MCILICALWCLEHRGDGSAKACMQKLYDLRNYEYQCFVDISKVGTHQLQLLVCYIGA